MCRCSLPSSQAVVIDTGGLQVLHLACFYEPFGPTSEVERHPLPGGVSFDQVATVSDTDTLPT